MGPEIPEAERVTSGTTHELSIRDPEQFIRLVRNVCRGLEYETVTDTVEVRKSEPGEVGAIGGKMILEHTRESEIQTRGALVNNDAAMVIGIGGWFVTFYGVVEDPLPFIPVGIVIGIAAFVLRYYDHERYEPVEYDNRIEVTIDSEVELTDDEEGGVVPRRALSNVVVETTGYSPYPDHSGEDVRREIQAFDRRLGEIVDV